MMKRYLPFLRQAFLYGIIGACSSGLDAALFALLSGPMRWDPYVTNVLTVHCGIFCSFLLNRRFNFKMTDRTLRRFLMFYATGLLGLLLSAQRSGELESGPAPCPAAGQAETMDRE